MYLNRLQMQGLLLVLQSLLDNAVRSKHDVSLKQILQSQLENSDKCSSSGWIFKHFLEIVPTDTSWFGNVLDVLLNMADPIIAPAAKELRTGIVFSKESRKRGVFIKRGLSACNIQLW